jgi:transcriptional regulator with XRE-family HTH domain
VDPVTEKIRTIRIAKGLNMRELAEKVGCSTPFISQMENGKASPSIATLKKIATVLGVRVVDFFMTEKSGNDIILRKEQRIHMKYPQGAAFIELLVAKVSNKKMQPIWAHFEPGDGSQGLYSHTGEEFGIIVKGSFELQIEDEVYLIEEGDTFYFSSDRKHGYRNPGDTSTDVLWVITPPSF